MTPSFAGFALSLPFACLLSGCHQPSAPELKPWIAEVLAEARPPALPEMTLPPLPHRWPVDATGADPFGLLMELDLKQQRDRQSAETADQERAVAAVAVAPPIRVVAVLRRAGAAVALLQIGGRMLQVSAGDALPDNAGRVLHIEERAVRVVLAGREMRLALGTGGTRVDAAVATTATAGTVATAGTTAGTTAVTAAATTAGTAP